MARFEYWCGRLLAVLLLTIGVTASAAEKPIALSANVGVASDYRYRGISLSDRKPALQGGIDATLNGKWFVGSWASTIEDYEGADVELDIYAGRSGELAGFDYSLGLYGYLYPHGRDVDYVELQGLVGHDVGPVSIEGEVAFVPEQWNSTTTNLYLGGKLSVPIGETGSLLLIRGGRENGFYDEKLDWEVGIAFERGPVSAAVSLVGSNYSGSDEAGKDGGTRIVAALRAKLGNTE